MDKHNHLIKIICLVLFFCFALPFAGGAKDLKIFRIGTGGKKGVYYPIGKTIAHGLTQPLQKKNGDHSGEKGIPGYIAAAQTSAGSVENIKSIVSGETEAGLIQADTASRAYNASGVFAGKNAYNTIRAVASLYSEKFQIVTRKDAGIKKVSDLKAKRISLDEPGSGTLSVMRIILAAHGLSEENLVPVYLKPLFIREKMMSGELQGFAMMAGTPMESVLTLSGIGLSLVPVQKAVADKINREYPYLMPGVIPAKVYPGIPETPTIQVYSLLAVSASMDNELAYRTTCALWSQRMLSLLKKSHPQAGAISLETALTGLSIPIHEGAKQFYREKGLLTEDKAVQ